MTEIHPALLAPPAPPEPVSVVDVAEYILTAAAADGAPEMETSKLHNLLYIAQANHLAVTNYRLFDEPFEAWVEGPIVPALHALLGGADQVRAGDLYAKLAERATADQNEV